MIQFPPHLLEPTANVTIPLPKSHIPSRTHFSLIHEPMCPAKPREPALNLPLGSICFLLQHPILSHFSIFCGLSPPQHVIRLLSYISSPSSATAKAEMMLPSSTPFQLLVGSIRLGKLTGLSCRTCTLNSLLPPTLGTRRQQGFINNA